jgi:glycosyltransferase involved in cell wall biosynthesis
MVLVQHEFGLFDKAEDHFMQFLTSLRKPVVLVFHTVLPHPTAWLKNYVYALSGVAVSLIVMTRAAEKILVDEYDIHEARITVIPHGTHLVSHVDTSILKKKYNLSGKFILSTFGLLSSGKSIETTLNALPAIVSLYPGVVFLVIGKTHPSVVKQEGYVYLNKLDALVRQLKLENHVQFIHQYLPLPELLEYLQLTDIYLFTSKDPHQAVSGTFSYALSCGCPIVSTPIPHALEVLKHDAGLVFDFEDHGQLGDAVLKLIKDDELRMRFRENALHRMAPTAWENAAIAHANLFDKTIAAGNLLKYRMPPVNLAHFKRLTTAFGMIQFSVINKPDNGSGYTLDDNARALIAICQHYACFRDAEDLKYISIYFNFIKYCQQNRGSFLNYVNDEKEFSNQNNTVNLADANGRAVWALGYLLSIGKLLPPEFQIILKEAESMMQAALTNVSKIHATRSMAFVIKGLYYRSKNDHAVMDKWLISKLANRLLQMYRHEADMEWQWFESYLTYANSILPEAMLCAWLATGDETYRDVAKTSFDFLLSKIFINNQVKVVSNQGWLYRDAEAKTTVPGGEQPIDVAYAILALCKFYKVFQDESYLEKIHISFSWFQGNNHLQQIIYNPCTGGCYDGLEETYVNLNQGAESTVSYLMARLAIEEILSNEPALLPLPEISPSV